MPKFQTPTQVKARLTTLGDLIRVARRERGFTQEDLATRAGTSRPTINRLESGKPNIAWGTVMVVCWLLNIPTDPDLMDTEKRASLLAANAGKQRIRSKSRLSDDF